MVLPVVLVLELPAFSWLEIWPSDKDNGARIKESFNARAAICSLKWKLVKSTVTGSCMSVTWWQSASELSVKIWQKLDTLLSLTMPSSRFRIELSLTWTFSTSRLLDGSSSLRSFLKSVCQNTGLWTYVWSCQTCVSITSFRIVLSNILIASSWLIIICRSTIWKSIRSLVPGS